MNGLGIKIALAVSLAVNLFVAGAFAGAAFQRHRTVEMRAAPVPGNPMMRVGEGLSPENREAFLAKMRQTGMANRPFLEANRAARAKVVLAFSAPVFDAAAAEQALADARQADMSARAQLETAVVEFAKGLKVEDRAKLAEGLRRGGPGGRGGGRRGGPDGRFGGPRGPEGRPFGPEGPPEGESPRAP